MMRLRCILSLNTINITNTNLTKRSLVFGWLTATNNHNNIERKKSVVLLSDVNK